MKNLPKTPPIPPMTVWHKGELVEIGNLGRHELEEGKFYTSENGQKLFKYKKGKLVKVCILTGLTRFESIKRFIFVSLAVLSVVFWIFFFAYLNSIT